MFVLAKLDEEIPAILKTHLSHTQRKVSTFPLGARPQPTRESSRVPPTLLLSSSPSPEQSCSWPLQPGNPPSPAGHTWPCAPHLGPVPLTWALPVPPGLGAAAPKWGALNQKGEGTEGSPGVEGTKPSPLPKNFTAQGN